MGSLVNLLSIIITIGVIVFVHEGGHFIFAKLGGIKVNEFSIGMGPAVATWKKGETTYSVRALPLGGYCLMDGMLEESGSGRGFNDKPVLTRLMVSFAGPLFNFILAFLLSIIICNYYVIDPPVLTSVMEGGAAEEAGFEAGDEIVAINGSRIYNYREITLFSLANSVDTPAEFTYMRDGQQYKTTLKRKLDEESGNYYFGFESRGRMANGVGEVLKFAALDVRFQMKATVYSIKMLITGKASKDDLMGPVGIGHTMNDIIEDVKEETAEESFWVQFVAVFMNIVNFAVLLSANLGVMNLLPIPALDGGRILFVLIEGISGKRVPPEKEAIVNAVGVVLLLLLTIFVFFNDVGNLFK